MKRTELVTLAVLALALSGCAGGRHRLHFDTCKVPVSLSQAVLDADGTIVPKSRQTFKGRFEGEFKGWSLFWTFMPLSRIDLSDAINARVEELGGNAVVRLRAEIDPGADFWNSVLWINMLPIWPGTVNVIVDADVIEVKPRTSPAPPTPPAPPTSPTPEESSPGH